MAEEKKMSSSKDIDENKLMAALAYVIVFIPLFLAKDSKFAQFHTKQGLVLFVGWIFIAFLNVIPILGWILSPILALVAALIAILGIVMALQGKEYRIPIIAEFADKIKM